MKTLVNKNNPQIRITAPEIKVNIDTQTFYIGDEMFDMEDWTLVEEEPSIVKTIKEFVEKGKRCEQQAVEDNDQENYVFWGGFRNCAENILREVEEPTEGIKGNSEEIPSNVDLEKEMIAYIERHFHIRYDETLEVGNDPLTTHDFEEIARHFYELGFNARMEK